ncbi:MAG TPA: serine/threonine-protein kinase [Myxococcales bacterium]|nr:serine/threonine-protein kinase [Myxococcales bacterium]
MIQVSRDQLVEDSVFILQCLRQNARGGRANDIREVRSTLAGSVALDLGAYVAFLKRFGYVEIDSQAAVLQVTAQGERAAVGDADVSRDVSDHFAQVLTLGSEPPRESAFESLLGGAGLAGDGRSPQGGAYGDTQPQAPQAVEQPQVQTPALAPVEGELGQGPLGRVRVARFGELGRMVALKEYHPLWESLPWLSRQELSRRVRREAQAQAQLDHPCVLPILEVRGEDAQVVMPLAAGTLRDKLSRGGDRLTLTQAVRLAAQVAHALSHAHAQGLTHGAIKPENVLLDRAGNALVSDFGATRLVALPPATREGPRVMVELGDPAYRAPEVSASDPGGPQADAYALGALLHEMLAGAPRAQLPQDASQPVAELIAELQDADPARRPALAAAASRLARLLVPSPLFAL